MDMRAYFKPKNTIPKNGKQTSAPSTEKRKAVAGIFCKQKQKRPRPGIARVCANPRRLVTWNANGLLPRMKSYRDVNSIRLFLQEHDPDVICIQEARIKAKCNNPKAKVGSKDRRDRTKPSDSELTQEIKNSLQVFSEYVTFWSLADGRKAGTATFVHKRLFNGEENVQVARSVSEAIDSTQEVKRAQREGRFQFIQFKDFDLVNTYVPNCGWTKEQKLVRQEWDEDMKLLLSKRKEKTSKPLIWTGDLNVAHTSFDSTNEHFFRNEWDRDSKRHSSKESYNLAIPPEDRGIPGFSDNERKRFQDLLDTGELFDAWRKINPTSSAKFSAEDAAFTW
eukprot:CAMPEP_0184006190 /NCGR_PEP_ID=MMETSP0954-20121128/525_1 /TAXON_ID=627963 /ORGANISM="Aplanochytrium sp, Strain PBS07" /LENGTH=335 /DNA_ID=CAMNT_0026284651 /DNA_START=21 /DNA_END=1025 /DNA_ORIENTATION=-